MLNIVMRLALGFFACVGFVQVAAWLLVRHSKRGCRLYRVVPVGGEGKNTGEQMSLMYACLQWEANPAGMQTVLYDAGMDEEAARDCAALARGAGVLLVRSAEELDMLLRL